MMAAIAAARCGNSVSLYEKNEKLGKKLYITGKGRCNVTNACSREELFASVMSNRKFLYSAFYGFGNEDVMELLEELGCPLKTERGQRVFPVSDKSSDVIQAMARELRRLRVRIHLNQPVRRLWIQDGSCRGIVLESGETAEAEKTIVATGGLSYVTTGSTGDGYRFAKEAGHSVTELYPSLVPLETKESWASELQGLSLKNVELRVYSGRKEIFRDFGEMLFTHYGISGPLVLSASSVFAPYEKKGEGRAVIDLKPALTREQLDQRLLRDFEAASKKQFCHSLDHLLPKKLIPVVLSLSGTDPEKKVNAVTKEERQRLADILKGMELHIAGLRGYNEAVITKGGISVKEINPGTMESRLVPGLYFAGEVLDLDALTGGFNLQIAWSTGWAAGMA